LNLHQDAKRSPETCEDLAPLDVYIQQDKQQTQPLHN
jgi:hypothetical protein